MIYLLLGGDGLAKDQKIVDITKKVLPSQDAFKFDYEILHGSNLDPAVLKKALMSLPAVASKRLVVIRDTGKLNAHNQKLVLEAVKSKECPVDIILDVDKESGFVTEIIPYAQMVRFREEKLPNVFDMTRAMSMSKSVEAFEVLSNLCGSGVHPLQIMGGLVWYWENSKSDLSRERFKKGLLALQEADLNIKRSRLDPEYAIELLVVKLMEN